ncbi:hypothetical protein JQ628_08295 [Bradyrhizobium lablabi]|uniref:hypothetical protein n=1 Tax=Bradyrhizobium lablabi TaxID=722472 RepID=UPI001BAB9A46|nr:hypothetical protein [Bradyrhizobium lablabi]MBR1121507.1 hypothetical protein [Bradyrhizobium lablabi]
MLICILGLYVLSARARRRLTIQLRLCAERLAMRRGPLDRLAPPRRGLGGRARGKQRVIPQEE